MIPISLGFVVVVAVVIENFYHRKMDKEPDLPDKSPRAARGEANHHVLAEGLGDRILHI